MSQMSAKIRTNSGRLFDYLNPKEDDVNIHDIALGLSREDRYSKQSILRYYVGQHATILSYVVPERLSMQALHHEDSEAFMCDIPSPLKQLLPDYQKIEDSIMKFFYKKYGVSDSEEFKWWDVWIRKIEVDSLFSNKEFPIKIKPVSSREAYDMFVKRHFELCGVNVSVLKPDDKMIAIDDNSFIIYNSDDQTDIAKICYRWASKDLICPDEIKLEEKRIDQCKLDRFGFQKIYGWSNLE